MKIPFKKIVKNSFSLVLTSCFLSNYSFADNVLIIGGEGDSYVSVTNELQAAGHTVTYQAGSSGPSSLTGIQQVWDMRYGTALSANDIALYDTFLKNNGYLYLSGEHSGFAVRNNSLGSFLSTLGGGTITVSGGANNQQNANGTYFTSGTTVTYAAAAAITAQGGRVLSTDGSNATAYMWIGNAGDLGQAYNGTVIVVADINWTQSSFYGANNESFLEQLIAGIVAGTVSGTIDQNGSGGGGGGGGGGATDIVADHTKTYADLGATLNRVFAGGTLVIPTSVGSTFADANSFTINDVSGNALQVDSGVSATFSGIFSGAGGFEKAGAGTLILSGVNTYSGLTTVSAGTLLVGSTANESDATIVGSTTVASGATLGGYGTVGASGTTLTNSGTVSPANSIGTLRVGGAFVQNSSGNLAIEITPSATDLLAVSETASLAGTLTVTGASGTYSPTRYTLLTSAGRTGTFDTLSTNLSTFTTLGYFLSYDANNAYLTLGPDYVNTTTALTRNLEQLKTIFASQAGLQVSGLNYDCSTFGENNVCLSTGGRTSHVFNKSDAYDSSHHMTTSALLIGSYRLDPSIRLGGWIDQNLNTQDSNIKMSSAKPMLGIFGVYHPSRDNTQWQVKASASYVEKDLDITRQQLTNSEPGHGKTSFKGLAAQLDVAYGFAGLVPNSVISPVVGIRYYSGRANDYTEETSSSVQVPISYNKFREISGVAFAGLKLNGSIVPEFRYNLSVGVETDVKRNNPTYSGTSSIYGLSTFNIQGNSSPRDTRGYANMGVSYLIDKTQSINFGVYYRQDQFKKVESVSSVLTYTVGL